MSDDPFIDLRQIAIVHRSVWEAVEQWAASRSLTLVRIPDGEDGIATYMFAPAYKMKEEA